MSFETNLYLNINKEQWPIIYRNEYNVSFMGLEKLHPFDARKWRNIYKYLKESGLINKKTVVVPNEATKEDLLMVHTKKYLKKLNCSIYVARIAEVVALVLVPNYFIQRAYLKPMRFQTGGSVLAGKLALDRGWAINIGGGFHHCSASKAFSFKVRRVMIVDLDAHQGNGYERDLKDNTNVYIMDVYNKWIYPWDHEAKHAIRRKVQLDFFVSDDSYLRIIKKNLIEALNEFDPQLMVYNAGTDVLKGDKLGGLSITETAYGLVSKMSKFETGIMTILWNGILERLEAFNDSLQSPVQDLNTGYALYKSSHGSVQTMRPMFSDFEAKGKILTNCEEYQQQNSRRRKRNTKYDDFSGSTTLDEVVENQTPKQKLKSQVFIVIIDSVLSALVKRMEAYHRVTGVFGILRQLKSLTAEEILKRSPNIVRAYQEDLEESVGAELVQFVVLLKTNMAAAINKEEHEAIQLQFYELIMENSLESCFPNGIIKRDEIVFREAISRSIPIVMLTSGGYLKKTAKIIANSIIHLYKEGLIHGPQEYYF
ncbi:hypothetical protein NQ314_020447 [Rhamnusium bicolor]|uniref:Histone deacetylase domain-containing protein n=1 Tax=Rhamnusium bicolor TaxID=1586634 RepID=A0AAV8WLR7_9CUCU|nr:hypothetical protein NQ314_020447 [Rhamnusium bicolor]